MTDVIAKLTEAPEGVDELTIPSQEGPGGVTVTRTERLLTDDEAKLLNAGDVPEGYKIGTRAGTKAEREALVERQEADTAPPQA